MYLTALKSSLLHINLTLPLKDPVLIFSVVLFIILLAPVILRKFRIPSIIGLIIAGVAIGPHGFHLMDRDSSIQLFGTVGLLYIMFLAGLELDLNEFKKNKNRSLVFGILTFSFPFVLGILACHFLLKFSYLSSILISSMFSTHTLVAYPIASKLGISKNNAVTIAVGGTIITDTVVLLILAVITGANKGELNEMFWIRLGISLLLFGAVLFFLFPIIGKWFFRNMKGDNVSEYIFVLAMVFLAAFLAELAGVEAIIGAFMAGLALNRLIPHTSPVMNRIEFVGNALFIPFFLLGVGMLVDLKVLFKGAEALAVAGILIVVAFSGKWIAAFLTQKIFHYTVKQRNVLFGLTSAHAAATLAVILIGFQIGLVNESVLNGTIILILVSCLIASFITENAGRKLVIEEEAALPEVQEENELILVPISNPDTIVHLIDFAVMIKDKRFTVPIYSLTIVEDNNEAAEKVLLSKKMQETIVKHASGTDHKVKSVTRIDLSVVSGITRAMKEIAATDLVMGWSPKISASDRIFGTKVGTLMDNIWKNIYVCHFVHPINTANRMLVVMPKYIEYEMGFAQLVQKIHLLALEAGLNVELYSTEKTYNILLKELEKLKSSIPIQHHLFAYFEDLYLINKRMTKNDLLLVTSARKRTISYEPYFDNLPGRLNKYFPAHNFILIYPEQHAMDLPPNIHQEDLNLSPIQEQLENLTHLGRTMKRIFRSQAHPDRGGKEENPPEEKE